MSERQESVLSRLSAQSALSRIGSSLSMKTQGTSDTLDRAALEKRKQLAYSTRRHVNIYDSVKIMKSPIPFVNKSEEVRALIRDSLKKNVLFNNVTDAQMESIVMAMKAQKIAKDTKLIEIDDIGNTFYVIQSGTFALLNRKGKKQKTMKGK